MFSESVGLILKAHDRRLKFSNLNFFILYLYCSLFAWVGESCLLCWLIGAGAEKRLEGVCAVVLWRNVLSQEPAWDFILDSLEIDTPVLSECDVEHSPLEGKSHLFNNSSNTYGLFISSLQFIFSEIHHLITLNRCLVHMPLWTECSLMFLFTQPPLMGPGWQLVLEPIVNTGWSYTAL